MIQLSALSAEPKVCSSATVGKNAHAAGSLRPANHVEIRRRLGAQQKSSTESTIVRQNAMNDEINKLIVELVKMGLRLPENSLFRIVYAEAVRGWMVVPKIAESGLTVSGLPTSVVPTEFAHAICAMEFLKQYQHKRPILQTTHDGDWYMEINYSVDQPAIHWDRQPYESIIRSIHAHLTKNKEPK
jgi:hypothetical protein